MSRVDVIIPCYKYAHYLRGCVESVLTQSGVDVRVLIIDDCSPDDTEAVGTELARLDRRVEFRRHAVNQKHIATYNEGLAWAAGDYLLLLSADDLLTPGALGRAARVLDAHPEVGLVYGRQVDLFGDQSLPPVPPVVDSERTHLMTGLEFIEACCALGGNRVSTPTAVVRTALQQQLGGYLPALPHSGDMEMWLRFAAHASVCELNACQAYYRWHEQNMQWQYAGLRDFHQRKAAFDTLFREYGARLPECARLQALAERALAQAAFWDASKAFDTGAVAVCKDLLEFAAAVYPPFRSERCWSHLRWKQRLGPQLWRTVRPWLEWFRGAADSPPAVKG
jgi:glycosyltransferase involved in cell wall biosynthesis